MKIRILSLMLVATLVPRLKVSQHYKRHQRKIVFQHIWGLSRRPRMKAGKPWKSDASKVTRMMEADPHLLFVVGLSHGFLERDFDDYDDYDKAVVHWQTPSTHMNAWLDYLPNWTRHDWQNRCGHEALTPQGCM
jgi:hypothetical protein